MQDNLSSALAKAARLEHATPLERLDAAVREESEHIAAQLLHRLGQVTDSERGSDVFRELAARLELRSGNGVHAAELTYLRRRAEALGAPALARAIDAASQQMSELTARVEWLVRGTPAALVEALDPHRDSDRLYCHLLRSFRAEARIVETLAINRVSTWESLALFLRSTREAQHNPVGRFFDTYGLFANFFEWGEASLRGSQAVQRINQIHGRYFIPNEGMKYVLLNTAFTWLDGIDRIGHRALSSVEREGFFNAHVRLGRAMHIEELSFDYAEMYAWFRRTNQQNAFHTPLKTETFELFVKSSFGAATRERDAMLRAARVAMDEQYRAALGYAAPAAGEVHAVRASLAALAERLHAGPGAIFVRSLEPTPARPASSCPSELGVSERSSFLPRASTGQNGGYPELQSPLPDAASAAAMPLPVYGWEEIRRHVSDASTWIVIDGDVYDVSAWLEQHPGGAERLREWAGRDASRAFREAAHGPLTQVLRLNFRIGSAVGAEPGPT